MGADSSAENTPNAPEFISPICLPKPKSSGFQEKRLHWASVVRGAGHKNKNEFAAGWPNIARKGRLQKKELNRA